MKHHVLGVRQVDPKRGGVVTQRGKLKKKSLTIYHKPKPLFRAKFQQKRRAARWKKQPLVNSPLEFWGKTAKWPFERKIKGNKIVCFPIYPILQVFFAETLFVICLAACHFCACGGPRAFISFAVTTKFTSPS